MIIGLDFIIIQTALMLCAEEGNTTEPNSSRYTVRLADIKPKVTPGEYRLVVFTAKKHYMHHLH